MPTTNTTFDEWLRGYLLRSGYSASQIAWFARCDHEVITRYLNGVTATLKSCHLFALISNKRTPDALRDAIRSVFLGNATPAEVDPDLNGDGQVDTDDLHEAHRLSRCYATTAEAIAALLVK